MRRLRTALFAAAFVAMTAALCVLGLPLLVLPRRHGARLVTTWAQLSQGLLKAICGIGLELRGRHNLPRGAALVAAKHQSAWETIALMWLLDDPAVIYKRELERLPIFGAMMRRFGNIALDRSGGGTALRRLIGDARAVAAAGRPILIFPEGTRRAPGAPPAYQRGVVALYRGLGVPCVPIALNSGLAWPAGGWPRGPGTIVVEILDPIAAGLDGEAFLATLEARIEAATDRLLAGADA